MRTLEKLTIEDIRGIFGHEAAEDEDPSRLREYYFKTKVFDQITAELPLTILVGHKGIGKSALFKVAQLEDADSKALPILIRPDDVQGIGLYGGDFNKTIRDWKDGLRGIIAQKVISAYGESGGETSITSLRIPTTKIVNFIAETFESRLNINLSPAKDMLVEKFLKFKRINVYIDDLDRGWSAKPEDSKRISAMLNAARDICNENQGVQIRIALRTDVYHLVRTSDESTDKIEGQVVWHSWTNHEIYVMLVKRILTFWGLPVDESGLMQTSQKDLSQYLEVIMEPRFFGSGNWEKIPIHRVLMSLIRKRPRDLVKLCTLAGKKAIDNNHNIIKSMDFEAIFEEYSQGRLQDTINEYRSELPDIQRLLFGMRPNKREKETRTGYTYTTDALLKKIASIIEQGQFSLSVGGRADTKKLAQFMYKINFLTARKESGDGLIIRKYFEENRYLSSEFVDFGFDWEVHPAYRWALQPENIKGIFSSLLLSRDDR